MMAANRSKSRDPLVLGISIFATIAATIIFSARRIALYDFNYIANAVHRMSLGESPYKDFDLVLPPVAFIPVYFFHHFFNLGISTSMLISAFVTQVTSLFSLYSILRRFLLDQEIPFNRSLFQIAMGCAAIINVISIYPNYIYDSAASALALVTIAFLLRYLHSNALRFLILSQIFALLTFFTKFNMGGSLIIAAAFVRFVTLIKTHQLRRILLELLTFTLLFSSCLLLISIFGLSEFIDQTVIAPSQFKGIATLGQLAQYNYPVLIIMIVIVIIAFKVKKVQSGFTRLVSFSLVIFLGINLFFTIFTSYSSEVITSKLFPSASFAYPILMLLSLHCLLTLKKFSPDKVLLLVTIPIYFFGTFLSQGWAGSSYSLNPLLILLLVTIHLSLDVRSQLKLRKITVLLLLLLTMNFLTLALNGGRLGYVVDNGVRSQEFNWARIGTALSKEDVSQVTQLREILDREKQRGSLLELPAEDSLQQFSKLLTPWSRCLQFTFICPTKPMQEVLKDFKREPPDFVVLKTVTQINRDIEPVLGIIEPIVNECFSVLQTNRSYRLFKAEDHTRSCVRKKLGNQYE